MKSLTVFTPAYNRAHTLQRLHDSLVCQSCQDFEWLIVDDGSRDNTQKLIHALCAISPIEIRYFYQNNAGQHVAMNRGIEEAHSELFFMVDSDDYLPNDAIGYILERWQEIRNDPTFCGIVGNRCFENGETVGMQNPYNEIVSDFLSYRSELGIQGDRAEVIRTNIIKQYLYPVFPKEKSLPIAVMFNRIAQNYKALYINKCFYIADYAPDGMGAYWTRDRIQNPQGTALYYSEIINFSSSIRYKIRMALNYWRYSPYYPISLRAKFRHVGKWASCCWLPGMLLSIKDRICMNRPISQPTMKHK